MNRPYSVNIWTCKAHECAARVGFVFTAYVDARNAAYLAIHAADMGVDSHGLPKRMKPGAVWEIKARAGYPIVRIERES